MRSVKIREAMVRTLKLKKCVKATVVVRTCQTQHVESKICFYTVCYSCCHYVGLTLNTSGCIWADVSKTLELAFLHYVPTT
jgi:hypothetical protein